MKEIGWALLTYREHGSNKKKRDIWKIKERNGYVYVVRNIALKNKDGTYEELSIATDKKNNFESQEEVDAYFRKMMPLDSFIAVHSIHDKKYWEYDSPETEKFIEQHTMILMLD